MDFLFTGRWAYNLFGGGRGEYQRKFMLFSFRVWRHNKSYSNKTKESVYHSLVNAFFFAIYSCVGLFSRKLILSADMPAAGNSLNFSTPLHFTDPPKTASASGEINNGMSFQKTEFFLFLFGALIVAAVMAYFCCRSSRTKANDVLVVQIESWLRAFNLV